VFENDFPFVEEGVGSLEKLLELILVVPILFESLLKIKIRIEIEIEKEIRKRN
jgi:hypothetical protein